MHIWISVLDVRLCRMLAGEPPRRRRKGLIECTAQTATRLYLTRPASGQELVDESPFSARCRDMGANRSAVDVVMPALGHRLGERDGHTLPHTAGAPAPEAPVN